MLLMENLGSKRRHETRARTSRPSSLAASMTFSLIVTQWLRLKISKSSGYMESFDFNEPVSLVGVGGWPGNGGWKLTSPDAQRH